MEETKKAKKQRMLHAQVEYNKFVHENVRRDHSDYTFEPKNFTDWMRSCEEARLEGLRAKISFLKSAIEGASRHGDIVYCASRRHYLCYAEESLKRRFPDEVIDSDECPF